MLKETDPALYRELLEKDAMKRAQERISLKHKNTSKVFIIIIIIIIIIIHSGLNVLFVMACKIKIHV